MYLNANIKIPQVGYRHFRDGKEAKGSGPDLQLGNLSMRRIVQQVIARHTSDILETIEQRLGQTLLYSTAALKLKKQYTGDDSIVTSLLVQLTADKCIKLLRESVTGRFAVQPASMLNSRLEHEINKQSNAAADASAKILYLRALTVQAAVDESAELIGWKIARSVSAGREAMRQHFPKGIQQLRFYHHLSWHRNWLVAFTVSAEGDVWWIAELDTDPPVVDMATTSIAVGRGLKAIYRIPMDLWPFIAFHPTKETLQQIERSAAGFISQHIDARVLAHAKIWHKIPPVPNASYDFPIILQFTGPRVPKFAKVGKNIPWASGLVKLEYKGLSSERGAAVHVASVRLERDVLLIAGAVSSIPFLKVSLANKSLAFRLQNRVGDSCIGTLYRFLILTERLFRLTVTAKDRGLQLAKITSLDEISLGYKQPMSRHLPYRAMIRLDHNKPDRLTLPGGNPHLRIADFLNNRLAADGLDSLISALEFTLPLMTTFSSLETKRDASEFSILPRSEYWYTIRYRHVPPPSPTSSSSAPAPKAITSRIEIRVRDRRGNSMWFIPEEGILSRPTTSGSATSDDDLYKSLRAVTRGRGEGWQGKSGGIVADANGIAEVVRRLDEILWNRMTGTPKTAPEATNTAAAKLQSAAGQLAPQPQPAPAPVPGAPAPVAQMTAPGKGKDVVEID